MICKSRSIFMILAVIGFGLAADGRIAHDGVSGSVGPDNSLAASLTALLAETGGSAIAYAQTRRNCETARRGARSRRCVQRTPWSFSNGGDTNADPLLTPDGRFVVFASRENLDDKDGDSFASVVDFDTSASSDIFRLNLQNGALRRVSVDRAGNLPPPVASEPPFPSLLPDSVSPAISANGRLVAFATDGAFLPEDRNDSGDVYLKNLRTGELGLVSTASRGGSPRPASGGVAVVGFTPSQAVSLHSVAMSGNGRFVAFMTSVRLNPDRDQNDLFDVYVKDLKTNEYFLASFDSDGKAGGIANDFPVVSSDSDIIEADVEISANGRFVAFTSRAAFEPVDNNDRRDVYIWDRLLPDTSPVLASPGAANGIFSRIGLSANGRFVAFVSDDALVPHDMNGVNDIYRFDRLTDDVNRRMILVSVDAENRQTTSANFSNDVALSANGRFVAFSSDAGDLVLDDTNTGDFTADLFVKDLRTGAITRASVDEDGIEPDGRSFSPSLSADGSVITFLTDDANLLEAQPGDDTPGDTVVVTAVDFAALPVEDISGDPVGAASIGPVLDEFGGGGLSDFALRSTIDRQGDQDWFRVSLLAARTYQIDLEGLPTRQGTLDDPLLHVFRAKAPGQIPEPGPFDDDGGVGLNAKVVFQPPVDGTYFISAEGFGAATGTYRLLVREQ